MLDSLESVQGRRGSVKGRSDDGLLFAGEIVVECARRNSRRRDARHCQVLEAMLQCQMAVIEKTSLRIPQ